MNAEKTDLTKKLEPIDKLKGILTTKDKEIYNLKVQIDTKDKLLSHAKNTEQVALQQNNIRDEIIVEVEIKKVQEMYIQSTKHECTWASYGE